MKVAIRPLKIEDAEASYKWRNNEEIWSKTGSSPERIISKKDELDWIQKVIKRKDELRFAICVSEEEKYIGNIQLTNIKDSSAEFHIFIGEKSYWGKGIAHKAMLLILRHGFEVLNLEEIYLRVRNDHARAIKLYKKQGPNYSLLDSKTISFNYNYPETLLLSLVNSGGPFNQNDTSQAVDFGVLANGQSRINSVCLIIQCTS